MTDELKVAAPAEADMAVQDIAGLVPPATLTPATTSSTMMAYDPTAEDHAERISTGAKAEMGMDKPSSYKDPVANRELLAALEADEIDTYKGAMRMIAYDTRYTPEQRAMAINQVGSLVVAEGAGFTKISDIERTMSLATRANEQRIADAEGALERKTALIEDKAKSGGRVEFEAYQTVESPTELLQYREYEKKGDIKGMAQAAIAYADSRWKVLSWDTAAALTPVGALEVSRGREMVRYLDDPAILKIADKWNAVEAQLSYGQFKEDMAKTILKLPKDRQIRVMNRLVNYLKMQYSTGQDGNALVELGMANTLLERLADPNFEEGFKYNAFKLLDTLGGALDATVIGGAAARTLKLATRLGKTTLRLSRVAPNHTAAELAEAALQDPTMLSRLGVQSIDDVGEIAFGSFADTLRGTNVSVDIAPAVREKSIAILNARELIRKSLSNKPVTLSTEQIQTGMLNKFNRVGLVPQTDLMTITSKGDVIDVVGRFGKGPNEGFATVDEAYKAANELTDGNVGVEIAVRHQKSGTVITPDDPEYIKITEDAAYAPEQYEYFAQLKYNTSFDEIMNTDDFIESAYIGQKLGFVERTLFSSKRFGRVASALWDNKTNAAAILAAGNKRHVQDLLSGLVKPETDALNSAGRAQLNKALVANSGKDEVFSTGRLIELGVTDKGAQKAYYAYRNMFDVAHEVADAGLARSMRSQGYRQILGDTDKVLGYGQRVSLEDIPRNKSLKIRVLEEGGDVIKDMNLADLSRMMDEDGAQLFRMREVEWIGKDEIAYTLSSSKRVGKSVRQVPSNGVLPRAAGYYPEMIKGNLAVYGTTPSGRRFLLATAETSADAKRVKEELLAEYNSLDDAGKAKHVLAKMDLDAGVNIDLYRGYKDAISRGTSEGVYENLNGAVYGHKGGYDILNASGDASDANWLDPITATQAMFSLLANNYTKGSHITSMQKQLTKFAKDNRLLGDGYRGGDVVSIDQLVDGAKLTGEPRRLYDNAVKRLETIDAYRILPDEVDVAVSNWMKGLGNSFAEKFPWMEGKLLARSQEANDPFATLNRFFHFTNIVTNPIRQYAMNSAQALTNLAHPAAFAKAMFKQRGAFQNALFLRQDMAMRSIPTADIERAMTGYAKWMGISRKELDDLLDTYMEGGLWNQVAHNTAARAAARSELEAKVLRDINKTAPSGSLVEDATDKVKRAFGVTNDLLNDVGFALGEHENTLNTFLTLFNAHRKDAAFDISKQAGREMLAGKTQTWIGNMTPEGRAGFQQGWLKSMFQYAAFPYKMALLMLPKSLGGSKALTNTEKAGIVLSQTMMWGSDATKFGQTVRQWFEDYYLYDPDVTQEERVARVEKYRELGLDKFFQLGVAGTYMNSLLANVHNMAVTDLDDWDDLSNPTRFGDIMSAGGGLDLIAERARATAELAYKATSLDAGGAFKAALEAAGGTNGRKLSSWWEYGERWLQLVGVGDKVSMEPDAETFKWLAKDGLGQLVGMYDKNLSVAAAKHYGVWVSRNGSVVREYEDNLRNSIAGKMGAPSMTEAAYYELLDKEPLKVRFEQDEISKSADQVVKEIMGRIRTLPTEGDRANNIHDAFLIEHDKRMLAFYRSLPPEIARQLQAEVAKKMNDLASGDTAESRILKRIMGEPLNMGHTGDELKKVIEWQANALVQTDPAVSEALFRFANEHEHMKRSYEED